MSAEIINDAGGVVIMKIQGKLAQAELASVQRATAESIRRYTNVRVLVIVENFSGWDTRDSWSDISFQAKHDRHIEALAIVGEKKWEELALLFTSEGLRPFPIRYFEAHEAAEARDWLESVGTEDEG